MSMKALRNLIAFLLVLNLACLPALAATKDELVYVTLSPAEAPQIYVVNRFSDLAGETDITDYGSYQDVINLTNSDDISSSGDVVTFRCGPEDFYYQGKLAGRDIPWSFRFSYFLNGNSVSAEDLRGANGAIEIEIHMEPNASADEIFLNHYMLQMTVNLDTTLCKNIVAENSTQADLGTNRVLTYMLLSGEPQDIRISCDAADFRMEEITINALPLSMDFDGLDTSSLTGKVSDLTSAISQINSGTQSLNTGASALSSGASSLSTASSSVSSAIGSLSNGSQTLALNSSTVLSSINDMNNILNGEGSVSQMLDVLETLETFVRQLESNVPSVTNGVGDFSDLASLTDGISAVGDHSGDIAKVREALNAIYASNYAEDLSSYTAAAEAVCTALEQASANSQIVSDFKTTVADQNTDLQSLDSFLAGLADLKQKIADLKLALDDYLAGDITIAGLRSGVSQLALGYAQLDAGMQSLSSGLGQLDTQYGLMDDGIQDLDDGASSLASGASAVSSGTGLLKEQTGGMDEEIDTAVGDALDAFSGDFDPVSFVDSRNQVSLVQFVIRTDEIPAAEKEPDAPEIVEEPEEENLLDRFLNLFK